jgi:hypothetical protein
MTPGMCRICGCTELTACLHEEAGPCWWVEHDLCSHCAAQLDDVDRNIDPLCVAMAYEAWQPSHDEFDCWAAYL